MIALIPARGGSKGIPRKNLVLLKDRPLIYWTIKVCKESEIFSDIYVSSEDEEILSVSKGYGVNVIKRPQEFSTDLSTDLQVIKHFFDVVSAEELSYLRTTTPNRKIEKIKEGINKYYNMNNSFTGFRSLHELPESPYKFFKIENGVCKGFFEDFNGIKNYTNLPRQIFPKAYHPNGYLDIVKKSTIESNSDFGNKIYPFETEFVVEIDNLQQLRLVEGIMK